MVNDDGSILRYLIPKCVHCQVGKYQQLQGQTSCKECPNSYTTLTTGARSKDSCYSTQKCSPGMFSVTGVGPCEVCPPGTYSINNGSTSCFNCSDETTQFFCPTNLTIETGKKCEFQLIQQPHKQVCIARITKRAGFCKLYSITL